MLSWFKRSGHATVVAYLALFLAVGGGAFAIAKSTKINGSKLKKRSVDAAKLKKHTITQTEVNLAKLGKVPAAGTADTATTANTASTATVASGLTTMSPMKVTTTSSSASGANIAAAAAAATPVTLYEDSQFRLYGKCYVVTSGPELEGVIYIATKQNGAIFDSEQDELPGDEGYLDVDTSEDLREIMETNVGTNNSGAITETAPFDAVAQNGYGIEASYQVALKTGTFPDGNGPYGPGNVCLFQGYVIHS